LKKSLVLIAFAVFALVGAEVFARFQVGLGDPPLTVRDPDIEYLFKPSRCYRRFGNDVCYNRWSMRSPEADRFPILVLGDSVVNGGSLTDDSRLGTAILARHLGVAVGNVSAGSWGPPNLLEYTERFGWFGAQSVIVVASSHDLDDIPTTIWTIFRLFRRRSASTFRKNRRWPRSGRRQDATSRAICRLPAAAPGRLLRPPAASVVPYPRSARCCRAPARTRAGSSSRIIRRGPNCKRMIGQLCKNTKDLPAPLGIPLLDLSRHYTVADYRDDIHLNDSGQRSLAKALLAVLER